MGVAGVAYNIADLFEHAVDAVPDRAALVVDDRPLSFAELDAAANRFAHHLADNGLGAGDHVGIYAANCREWVEAMLGTFKIRAVPINVNFRYVADELRYLLDNADLKALVFEASLAARVAAVRDELPQLGHLIHVGEPSADGPDGDTSAALAALGSIGYDEAVAAARDERDFGERSPDDLYVLYTGGTTGMPKGVMWRHEDVFYALGGGIDIMTNEPVSSEWELAETAKASESSLVSLCLPPLMHGAAQWSTMRFFFAGQTSVLARRFDPVDTWRLMANWGVNSVIITGDAMGRPMIEALEALDADGEQLDLSSLITVASSAAIFSPTVKDRYLARFPNLLLVDAIGSTETGSNGMVMVQPGHTEMRGGPTVSASRDAVVLDDDLRPLAGTGTGRLARRGNVPVGYYKDEVKTKATFVTGPTGDRYALAGDAARLEDDGSITLLGRGSVCINTGGEKVYPEEVEAALKAHPDIFDAIVVGLPDDRWGQKITAVIQPRTGAPALTLSDVSDNCRTKLAGYKVPKMLVLVEKVERSPSGKPDYPWAQKVAQSETAAS